MLSRKPVFWDKESVTPRELEVVALVADGLSAKEIATNLGIAQRTVERHIENVREKMMSRNSAHMAAEAVRSGLVY